MGYAVSNRVNLMRRNPNGPMSDQKGEKLIERVQRGEAITIDDIMDELGMGEGPTKSEPKHTNPPPTKTQQISRLFD